MEAGPERPVVILGDRSDPWVEALASAVPEGMPSVRLDIRDELPVECPETVRRASVLVLHRTSLSVEGARRLADWRARPDFAPRVILCIGAYGRYAELTRWAPLADLVLTEATARAALGHHLTPGPRFRPRLPQPTVGVVSAGAEMRSMLVDAVRAADYPVVGFRDWPEARSAEFALAVWDVPALDPAWPELLERVAARGPVIALIGMAERREVETALVRGAVACLDSPLNPDDLAYVLDRVVERHGRELCISRTGNLPRLAESGRHA